MSFNHDSLYSIVQEVSRQLEQKKDNAILEQLNDFISRGLIVIESTQPILTRESDSYKIVVSQQVKLTLKDKEYIEKLEEENKRLNQLVSNIQEYFKK